MPIHSKIKKDRKLLMINLFDFVKLSEDDHNLRDEIASCSKLDEFEKILKNYQCQFSIKEIEKISRDLGASYWPWAEKTRLERKNFFRGE